MSSVLQPSSEPHTSQNTPQFNNTGMPVPVVIEIKITNPFAFGLCILKKQTTLNAHADRIARNSSENGLHNWQRRSNCSEFSEKRFTHLAKTTELLATKRETFYSSWQRRPNNLELSEKRFTHLAKTNELLMLCDVINDLFSLFRRFFIRNSDTSQSQSLS